MSRIEQVFVHIGSDKAGSSAIQGALYYNQDWLRERGVFVPTTGFVKGGGHADLVINLAPGTIAALADEISTSADDCTKAVISWEGTHFFDDVRRARLREALEALFPGARIHLVYYLRNQIDLIQSGVLQEVKQLNTPPATIVELNQPFEDIPLRSRRKAFAKTRLFGQRIAEWQESFPDADLIPRLYDRRTLFNGDAIDDFLVILGVEIDSGLIRATSLTNVSLSLESAIALGTQFGVIFDRDDRRRAVDMMLHYPSGSSSYLLADTRAAMQQHYAADNAAVVGRFPELRGLEEAQSRVGTKADAESVQDAWEYFVAQARFPTILEGVIEGRELDIFSRDRGWWVAGEDGLWTNDTTSFLRFRPRCQHFNGFTTATSIEMQGEYADGVHVTDRVTINGREYGTVNLTAAPIIVPNADLDTTFRFEIRLQHDRPVGPQDRAFRLQAIRYAVLDPT